MRYITIVISMMISITISMHAAAAQLQIRSTELAVGDKAPELKPFRWIKGDPFEKFSTERIYVIAFGATWCAPCAAAIPELSAMANKFKNDLTVLEVFVMEPNTDPPGTKEPTYIARVKEYVKQKDNKIQYNVAVDNIEGTIAQTWIEASGRNGVPHIFLIDKTNRIAWIGSNPKACEKAVLKLLTNSGIGSTIQSTEKNEFSPFTREYNPLNLLNKELTKSIITFSHLSRYIEGQTGLPNYPFVTSFRWAEKPEDMDHQGKVQVMGENLRRLYYMAYGDTLYNYPPHRYPFGTGGIYPDTVEHPHQKRSYGKYWYRPILEVTDSSLFDADYNSPHNRFNYILKVPKERASAAYLQERMQQDLKNHFGFNIVIEERMMPCWNLTLLDRTKKQLQTKTPGALYKITNTPTGEKHYTNAQVQDIIYQLEIRYGYSYYGNLTAHPDKHPPFVDATGIRGEIDYTLNRAQLKRINEEMSTRDTFNDYCKLLELAGFKLERSTRKMKVVVIRDP